MKTTVFLVSFAFPHMSSASILHRSNVNIQKVYSLILSLSAFPNILLGYFLHLCKIVEGSYSHCSLSVCLYMLVNNMPAEWMNQFGHGFR